MNKFDFQGKRKDQYESSSKILFWSLSLLILVSVISFLLTSGQSNPDVRVLAISVTDSVTVKKDTFPEKNIIIGDSQSPFVDSGDSTVTNLAICIGTNGAFNKSDKISELVTECKLKFPNSKLYVIQGSWGWGGVSNKTKVKDYYKKFSEHGVVVVEPPIGKIEPHRRKPIYKVIGTNLDSLVSLK